MTRGEEGGGVGPHALGAWLRQRRRPSLSWSEVRERWWWCGERRGGGGGGDGSLCGFCLRLKDFRFSFSLSLSFSLSGRLVRLRWGYGEGSVTCVSDSDSEKLDRFATSVIQSTLRKKEIKRNKYFECLRVCTT